MDTKMPTDTNPEESADALERFIQNVYFGEGLPKREARRNLERGLLRIDVDTRIPGLVTKSHGLLITDNGYFLTARHCVQNYMKNFQEGRVRFEDGAIFPITNVCAMSKTDDIALCKAGVYGPIRARAYRFIDNSDLDGVCDMRDVPIIVLTRRDEGTLDLRTGKMLAGNPVGIISGLEYERTENLFFAKTDVRKGDSGSPIVTLDGRIIGFSCAIIKSRTTYRQGTTNDTTDEYQDKGITIGLKLFRALELVHWYVRRLRRR